MFIFVIHKRGMSHAMARVVSTTVSMGGGQRRRSSKPEEGKKVVGFGAAKRHDDLWRCVGGCGACCKLNKGPSFPTPEDIFTDPSHLQLYRSMIGKDGWCIHYDKPTRKCSIYSERPYFCRVEPQVFEELYGISRKKFNKEACNSCRDAINTIYGPDSMELNNFNGSLQS